MTYQKTPILIDRCLDAPSNYTRVLWVCGHTEGIYGHCLHTEPALGHKYSQLASLRQEAVQNARQSIICIKKVPVTEIVIAIKLHSLDLCPVSIYIASAYSWLLQRQSYNRSIAIKQDQELVIEARWI